MCTCTITTVFLPSFLRFGALFFFLSFFVLSFFLSTERTCFDLIVVCSRVSIKIIFLTLSLEICISNHWLYAIQQTKLISLTQKRNGKESKAKFIAHRLGAENLKSLT